MIKAGLWIIKNYQILLLVAVVLSGMVLGVYLKGRMDERRSWKMEQAESAVEAIGKQQEIEYRVMTTPKVEIQNELEQKWCRDCQ